MSLEDCSIYCCCWWFDTQSEVICWCPQLWKKKKKTYTNKQATSDWIAKGWEDVIKSSPTIKIQALSDFVRKEFVIEVPKLIMYRAKNVALYNLRKEHVEEFKVLRKYIA